MVVDKFIPDGKTIGELLYGEEEYYVPPYQRDYFWKRTNLEDFWRDVCSINDETYYLGSMLFKGSPDNKKKMEIIDGQQRLTTITIFLASIRDLFHRADIDDNEDATNTQGYIIRKITKDRKIQKLALNLRNRDMFYRCFQCNLYEDGRDSYEKYEKEFGKKSTNRLIKEAYDFFKERMEEGLSKLNSREEKISYLNDLSDKVREKIAIISITVTDIKDAYNIFETINQRGAELAVADLFKNYLISKAQNKEEMVRLWENIFDVLDTNVKGFLKHYWHSKKGVTQDKLLFKELTKYIEDGRNNRVDIDIFTREIESEAIVYSAIVNEDENYWDTDTLEAIKEYNVLGIEQALPVLMVAKNKFNDNDFRRLIRDIISFSLRYNIICNYPANILERKYSDMARRIRGGTSLRDGEIQITSPNDAIKLIKELYPSDEDFKKNFLGKKLEKSKHALYIWIKINESLTKYEKLNINNLSNEHILPKKLDEEWKQYLRGKGMTDMENITELIYRIGNQTAMDVNMNNKARNKIFGRKRDENYKDTHMPINEDLKKITDWTEKEISSREGKYFEDARKIWRINFIENG